MSELARCFSEKENTEVHLVLYGITREVFYSVPDNVIVHKPSFRFNNDQRFFSTLKTMFYLRREIKKIDPDTILSFGEYWNNFFLLSTLGLHYPKFISDRSQPDKSLGRFHDYLKKWLYPKSTGFIVQTEKAKEIFLRNNKHNNIAVIGNPVREFKGIEQDRLKEKIVLMVGRLIKSKHQDILIEIFAKINDPEWKLVLVGYDHLKQKNMDRLKKLAKDMGINDRVVFAGKQDNVEEFYYRSSIFAFTSSSEGFPNVIGEAMSAGLPVVAFDCIAGPSEMINNGENGYLVPLFDKEEFENRLSLLMKDEMLREKMGTNARESIKRFSKDIICERFYEFIMSSGN